MTDICIVGAGPAGLVLALQLARAGVNVVILESSQNYKRSFRGESMQPDTVSIFEELGILKQLRQQGCLETHQLLVIENNQLLLNIDYSGMPYPHKFIMDIPQPVLLNALLEQLQNYSNCQMIRGATCDDLLWNNDHVCGIRYRLQQTGEHHQLNAKLVVGADGRYSKVRQLSKLTWHKHTASRDVVWFKMPQPADAPENVTRIMIKGANHLILLPTYPSDYRAGVNIGKGEFSALRQKGIEAFYQLISRIDSKLGQHIREHIKGWSDIQLLDIFTTTMPDWSREGLLLIGDAAHTVTPLLGQGVNLAIQDAMELAPMLAHALKENRLDRQLLKTFQAGRQAHIDFVVKLQMHQENLLNATTPIQQGIRRLNYRILNRFKFIQHKISNRIAYCRQRQLQQLASRKG